MLQTAVWGFTASERIGNAAVVHAVTNASVASAKHWSS